MDLVLKDSTKKSKKDSLKAGGGIIITPNSASSCYKTVDSWELDHYEAAPGKIVGIWPTMERWGSVKRLKQLKDTLGFNYMFINFGWIYDSCYAAGYRPDHMLGGGLSVHGGYVEAVTPRPSLWGYYTDEPISQHNGTVAQMEFMSNFFTNNYPNSIFATGENIVSNADLIDHTVGMITLPGIIIILNGMILTSDHFGQLLEIHFMQNLAWSGLEHIKI